MAGILDEPPGRLADLRVRMIRSALARGVGAADVEDVVQEALLKLLKQGSRPGNPSIDVRAFTALRDSRLDWARKERRSSARVVPLPTADSAESERIPSVEANDPLALFDVIDVVRSIVGRDAIAYTYLKTCRATDEDVGRILDWPPAKVARIRKRLSRSAAQVADAIAAQFE